MNLTAPALGMFGLLCLAWLLLYLIGLGKRWGLVVVFGLMLLASAMALPLDWRGVVLQTVWLPIQSRRSLLFMIAGVFGVAMLMTQFSRLKGRPVSLAGLVLGVMALYASLLRLYHGGPADGFQSLVFTAVTILPLLLVGPLSVDRPEDVKLTVRAVAVVNMVWVGMCALQFVANYNYLTLGNEFRFVGLMSNPQHTGALIAFWGVVSLWLLLNDTGRMLRFLYLGLCGANLVILMWTGSRTGLGMTVIGSAAVLYTRAGRGVLFMPVVLILGYAAFKAMLAVTNLDVGVDRLTSTTDTRSHAWGTLIRVGMDNPLFGAGTDEAEKSENSWLYAFASYGIGMLLLAMLLTLVAMFEWFRAVRHRAALDLPGRRLLDLALGVVAMYFAGAVLEGYIISRVSPSLCFFMLFSGILAALRRQAIANQQAGAYYDKHGHILPDEDAEYQGWDHGEPAWR